MIKFILTLNIKTSILLLISVLFFGACKKDKLILKTGNDTTGKLVPDTGNNKPIVNLPDEIMLVGANQALDSNKYTIYLLDAGTGQLVTRYDYPTDGHSDFCKPFVRNGLLYDVQRDKINAITMNTGAVLWTDNVGMNTDEASIILHDDTFYGITTSHDGTSGGDFVYALDAIKKSSKYLWKAPVTLGGNGYNVPINYYNGIIYITDQTGLRVTALDAKTGIQKWAITSASDAISYSLASLNNGIIIAGHTIIDATTGNSTVTVTDPVIPLIDAAATQTSSSLAYVTNDLYFMETTQSVGSLYWSFLSAIDRASGTEKWRTDFGSFTGEGTDRTETTEWIRSIWNNNLIVETSTEISSTPPHVSGPPIISVYKGGFSKLDVTTGLADGMTGGESSNANDFRENDGRGNFIAGNTLYGNFYPTSESSINIYAIDLPTGQLKWNSKPLSYSGIYDVLTYVYSRSQGKGYAPYINVNPHARAGLTVSGLQARRLW